MAAPAKTTSVAAIMQNLRGLVSRPIILGCVIRQVITAALDGRDLFDPLDLKPCTHAALSRAPAVTLTQPVAEVLQDECGMGTDVQRIVAEFVTATHVCAECVQAATRSDLASVVGYYYRALRASYVTSGARSMYVDVDTRASVVMSLPKKQSLGLSPQWIHLHHIVDDDLLSALHTLRGCGVRRVSKEEEAGAATCLASWIERAIPCVLDAGLLTPPQVRDIIREYSSEWLSSEDDSDEEEDVDVEEEEEEETGIGPPRKKRKTAI